MKSLFTLLAISLFTSCTHTPFELDVTGYARAAKEPFCDMGARFRREQFIGTYGCFKVNANTLAQRIAKPSVVTKGLVRAYHWSGGQKLRLSLGDRKVIGALQNFGPYRTDSRCCLTTPKGENLIEAESVFANNDSKEESDLVVRLYIDPVGSDMLIEEIRDYSVQRFILLTKLQAGSKTWKVRYIEIPGWEYDHYGRLHGIRAGKLFINYDGVMYAISFELLKDVEDLAYTIG